MYNYYWVTGVDGHGAATTAGPYMTAEEATDATAHLRNVQVHLLHTRQHDKARRILKDKMQGGGNSGGFNQGMTHSDEPLEPRSSLAARFRDLVTRQKTEVDEKDY